MTDFTSLLSSIGGQSRNDSQRGGPKVASQSSTSTRTQPATNGIKVVPNNAVAGLKRKSEEPAPPIKSKIARISSDSASVRNPASLGLGGSSTNAPYRGTARQSVPANVSKPTLKPLPKQPPNLNVSTGARNATDSPVVNKGAPKRGFASIMEKAKAAQAAAKATGSSGIKHKPVEKTTKRDRLRQQEEAQLKTAKTKKSTVQNTSGDPPPANTKAPAKRKGQEISYKGTMKKPPTQLAYKGTMRALAEGAERPKPPAKKGIGQDKYGGYASWSDLDDAEEEEGEEEVEEEEEEGGYGSDGSSDMEAGWGDTEREELHALRYAKQEDQEALVEEERLKREKLERKRRLQELSKSNAAKRKF